MNFNIIAFLSKSLHFSETLSSYRSRTSWVDAIHTRYWKLLKLTYSNWSLKVQEISREQTLTKKKKLCCHRICCRACQFILPYIYIFNKEVQDKILHLCYTLTARYQAGTSWYKRPIKSRTSKQRFGLKYLCSQ